MNPEPPTFTHSQLLMNAPIHEACSSLPQVLQTNHSSSFSLRNLVLTAGGLIFPAIAFAGFLAGKRRIASLAAITSASLIMAPTLSRNNSVFGPIFTRFRTSRREVWLTIDDGPFSNETTSMLDVLAQYKALATFFLVGDPVSQHPECVPQILAGGHTIGNHTQHHPINRFWALPSSAIQQEISDCSRTLTFAGAPRPRWFRSPVGMTNPCIHPVLARERLKLIGWRAGGMDGFISAESYWNHRILPRLGPGAILLIHQLKQGGGAKTLSMLLKHLHQLGYSCVLPHEATLC